MESNTYLDIQLKPAPLQGKKQLLISDEVIKWGDKTINSKDVKAVKYGSIAMGTMGIQTNQNYSFKFQDTNNKDLAIYFSSVSLAGPNEKLEDAFRKIEDAIWSAVTSRILSQWKQDLDSGKNFSAGCVTLMPNGVNMKISKLFSSREVLVPWTDVDIELYNGYLYIRSKVNKKDECSMNIQNEWNAITLYYFLNEKFRN